MLKSLSKSAAAIAVLFVGALPASGTPVSLNATNFGSQVFGFGGSQTTMTAGYVSSPILNNGGQIIGYNSFYNVSYSLFDLSSLAGQSIISGNLHFAETVGVEAYSGAQSSLAGTATFVEVTTPAAALTDTSYSNAEAQDIGGGTIFASANVNIVKGSRPTQEITATLNASAIAAINAVLAGSSFDFAFGQIFGPYPGSNDANFYLWNNFVSSPARVAELRSLITLNLVTVSAVPIPAALPLLASGLGLFGLLGWRSRRKTAGV